jgi:hydrogenase-4 component F
MRVMLLPAVLALPLGAALASSLARRRAVLEAVNLTAFAGTLLLAAGIGLAVLAEGPLTVWNGFLYADALSALVVFLTAFVALLCGIYAVGYLRQDEREETVTFYKLRKYYVLTPVFVFTMLLVALANNMGLMWVALEATTLASLFLITFYDRKTSLEAAWKYAIIGSAGLALALLGTILTYYAASRTPGAETVAGLNWSVLAARAELLDKTTMRLAFILVLLGYGTKAGIVPMHTWKPDAYSEAPVPAAAMLASATLNCALYGLARFYVLTAKCMGAGFPSRLLILFGLLSMGVSVPFVLVQRSFRRLMAYHTIDHAGIMVLGLGFGGALGTLGMLLHMTYHTVTKALLFLCAGNVQQHFKTDLFRRIKGGVIHVMPLTGFVFLMTTLAIIGAPPFSLFQSEFTILSAAVAGGRVGPAALFVVFGVAIFAGALLHIGNLVLGPADGGGPAGPRPWRNSALGVLGVVILVMGFWLPSPMYRLIQEAAKVLGGGP